MINACTVGHRILHPLSTSFVLLPLVMTIFQEWKHSRTRVAGVQADHLE